MNALMSRRLRPRPPLRPRLPLRQRLAAAFAAACAAVAAPAACSAAPDKASTAAGVTTTSPSADPERQPPWCVKPETGTFLTPFAHGWRQRVLLVGTGDRGVVLGAQANGGICQTLPFAQALAGQGYHVAVFDWGSDYTVAMAGATQALAEAGARRVVVGGFSRGAVVGLGAAPDLGPHVVGVVAVSGGPSESEGYPTLDSVSRFHGPLLLVAAADDPVFPKGTNRSIAARHAGREEVLLVSGSDHALALLDGEHGTEVRQAIFRFLAEVTR